MNRLCRFHSWTGVALAVVVSFIASAIAFSGCTESSAPAGPSDLGSAAPGQGPVSAAPVSSANALPADRFVLRGVLLGTSGKCPGCTLTLKQGSALVPATAEVGYDSGGALSFEELNALMRPGLPLHIRGDLKNTAKIADLVLVQSGIHTVGAIDRSSAEVRQTRAFIVSVRSTPIEFEASPTALIDLFPAGRNVEVFADVITGNRFLAVRILVH